jgi:hypothetical protein
VFAREESIMIPLHIIKGAATETQACFKGCIFYAIFHGGTMTPMDIVRVQQVASFSSSLGKMHTLDF